LLFDGLACGRNPIGGVSRYRNTVSRCGHKGIDVDIMPTFGMMYIQMLIFRARKMTGIEP